MFRSSFTQSLLCAHDAIAQKDFYPQLPDIPIEVDEDEETVKIVQLVKSNEALVRETQDECPSGLFKALSTLSLMIITAPIYRTLLLSYYSTILYYYYLLKGARFNPSSTYFL